MVVRLYDDDGNFRAQLNSEDIKSMILRKTEDGLYGCFVDFEAIFESDKKEECFIGVGNLNVDIILDEEKIIVAPLKGKKVESELWRYRTEVIF